MTPRPTCGYYLRQEHRLIRRHEESLELNPDNTATWRLRIDLELPNHPEAGTPDDNGECSFLFPLVYLRKNESRMQFRVYEEGERLVPIPIRSECDEISAGALSDAIIYHARQLEPTPDLNPRELKHSLLKITASNALEAAKALQVMRRELGLSGESSARPQQKLGARLRASGLEESFELLVEHVLLWVNIRGRPNERRSIYLSQEITLRRRALVRWSFGEFTPPPHPWRQRRWSRIAKEGAKTRDDSVLKIAGTPYGRRDRRFSSSALGERIGQPLGWMPVEFDLPTIYPKRCSSYHFEIRCPPGRTARALKVANALLPDGSHAASHDRIKPSRITLTSRSARFDVPRGGLDLVAKVHVTIGIGNGAFPLLWFLAGMITAAMLWVLAGADPSPDGEHAQTAAGILLLVPALVAGLAAASSDIPVSQSIGGARILLLATGLSAVIAASVLAGANPFHMSTAATWSLCAMAATITTMPLATSWLLSSPYIWRQMMKLKSYTCQKVTLAVGVGLSAGAVGLLALLDARSWARVAVCAFLLLMMILMGALANNRPAIPLGESRRYLGFAFLVAGLTCLGLACVELRCLLIERAQDPGMGPNAAGDAATVRMAAELVALLLLVLAFGVGDLLAALADRAAPRPDEIHVSPRQGRALLAEDSVAELSGMLRRRRTPDPLHVDADLWTQQTETLG